jgi:large subunit ribosomal protein L5
MADDKKKDNKKPSKGPGGPPPGMEKRAKKPKAAALAVEDGADEGTKLPVPPPRLIAKYRKDIVPVLMQKFGFKNHLAVPRLEKIVISMGVGRFAVEGGEGKAKMEKAERELTVIAGQKPQRCRAKKSVANFKIREGQETGLKVTLRGGRMYEFLDRMISLAFPRVKDFRGVNPKGFDGDGNYNFGFTEQTVFPEVDGASVTFQQGMNITMVTTASKPDHGLELLTQFGFPFRKDEKDGK